MYTLDISDVTAGDGKSVSIAIGGNASAAELEQLILELAAVRSNLLPPVPAELPEPGAAVERHDGRVQEHATFSAGVATDGSLWLWLRNSGLGWLTFHLNVHDARALADYLVARLPKGTQPLPR